jgi:hypothetical protein
VNPRDQIHAKAVSVTQQLSSVRILTSEMVLAEVLNSFSDAGPLRHAVGGMVQRLRNHRDVIIVPQTSEQFESALRRYKQAAEREIHELTVPGTVAETGLGKGPFWAARGTRISCKGWQQEAAS